LRKPNERKMRQLLGEEEQVLGKRPRIQVFCKGNSRIKRKEKGNG